MSQAASKRPKEQQEDSQHVSTGSTCCSAAPSQPTDILLPPPNGFLPPSESPLLTFTLVCSCPCAPWMLCEPQHLIRNVSTTLPCPASLTAQPRHRERPWGKETSQGCLKKKKSQGLSRAEHRCLSDEAAEEWQDSAEAAGSWPSCSDGARH